MSNLIQTARELLVLEASADPGCWTTDPSEFSADHSEVYDVPIQVFKLGLFKRKYRPGTNALVAQSRNHIRQLCQALIEAEDLIRISVASILVDEDLDRARTWLKKYCGEGE